MCERNKERFNILNNLEGEKHYIGSIFPDIIFKDKASDTPRFIIEIKKNGGIAQCLQQWKSASVIPAVLYIIVPENELATAKSVAQVVGLQVRFGTYTVNNTTSEVDVKYE
jgi:hypothetical protein